MTMSTRSRLSLFLAIATLVVAGILGSQGVSAGSPGTPPDGSEPAGGGFDDVAGICVEPDSASGAEPDTDCDDTIDDPVVVDPGECGEKVVGSGPDAAVSYTPCPGDEPPVVTDPGGDHPRRGTQVDLVVAAVAQRPGHGGGDDHR